MRSHSCGTVTSHGWTSRGTGGAGGHTLHPSWDFSWEVSCGEGLHSGHFLGPCPVLSWEWAGFWVVHNTPDRGHRPLLGVSRPSQRPAGLALGSRPVCNSPDGADTHCYEQPLCGPHAAIGHPWPGTLLQPLTPARNHGLPPRDLRSMTLSPSFSRSRTRLGKGPEVLSAQLSLLARLLCHVQSPVCTRRLNKA